MEICFECGIPIIISRNFEWSIDGQILKRHSPNRYVVIDCDQLRTLYELFTFLDGPRAATIICEARRKAMAVEIRDVLGDIIIRSHFYPSRSILGKLQLFFKAFGYGDLRLKNYDINGTSVIEFHNPHFQPFAEAEVKAIWEALEGTQAIVIQKVIRDSCIVFTLESAEEGRKYRLRKKLVKTSIPGKKPKAKELAGDKTCSTCGSPIEASRFTWNTKKGSIYDSVRERHVCLFNTQSLNELINDLMKHYDDKVNELILRAVKIYTRNLVKGSRILREMGTGSFLRSISIKGETLISGVEEDARGAELILENPWNIHFVSGEIAGWYEYIYNRRCETMLEERKENSWQLRVEKL